MNSENELVRELVEVYYLQKHAFPEPRQKILEIIVINLESNLRLYKKNKSNQTREIWEHFLKVLKRMLPSSRNLFGS